MCSRSSSDPEKTVKGRTEAQGYLSALWFTLPTRIAHNVGHVFFSLLPILMPSLNLILRLGLCNSIQNGSVLLAHFPQLLFSFFFNYTRGENHISRIKLLHTCLCSHAWEPRMWNICPSSVRGNFAWNFIPPLQGLAPSWSALTGPCNPIFLSFLRE